MMTISIEIAVAMVEDHSNRLYFHNWACNDPLDCNRVGYGSTLSSIASIYGCNSISLPSSYISNHGNNAR
jgi:hypothetical protein